MKTITEILMSGPKTSSELRAESELPSSSFYRHIGLLLEEKAVIERDGLYMLPKECPSIEDISTDMSIIHRQKLMDKNYRKLNPGQKADMVIQWYMEYQLKGKIQDYNEENLLNAIDQGSTLFITKNKLNWEKYEPSY